MVYPEMLLIKNGELALKGLNRRSFEDRLIQNLRRALPGTWQVHCSQSTIQMTPLEEVDMEAAAEAAGRVFGVARYSRAAKLPKNLDEIFRAAPAYLAETLLPAHNFKCEAKRADKTFPLSSPELCAALGEKLLEAFPHLCVQVKDPEATVTLEIRETAAFLHTDQKEGAGGLPVGSSGDAAVLISGGIDSPVAAWRMARRGLRLIGIHFASPPYTSERAEEKVHKLLQIVAKYAGTIRLFTVPFTELQEQIKEHCPEEYFTLIMRRVMCRIAEQIALQEHCGALVTGESLGQVASQTLQALQCTDAACTLPVFRPLIGTDKDEVVALARKIGTFETSILPYEDCCTVFTPRHPRTKPKLPHVELAESALDLDELMHTATQNIKQLQIHP